jgi:tyrosine-protein phosphatase YwqE
MFSFFKKKKSQSDAVGNLSGLKTDMHSHLLPGIDDGSPDPDTSIHLIKGMMEAGYKKFITTPHIYPDLYPNNRETILAAHAVLQQKLKEEQMEVEIIPAAEYFVDDLFNEFLDVDVPLLTIHKNWVLIEVSFLSPPPDLNQIIFKLITKGYQPVLAHPERYSYYHQDKDAYHRFKDQGCFLQINILSLAGYYGKSVQEAARYMIQNNLVELIGSDLHHDRHLHALQSRTLIAEVNSILESGYILNATL